MKLTETWKFNSRSFGSKNSKVRSNKFNLE